MIFFRNKLFIFIDKQNFSDYYKVKDRHARKFKVTDQTSLRICRADRTEHGSRRHPGIHYR